MVTGVQTCALPISRIIGAVVDVEFPPDAIPAMYNALKVTIQATGQGEEPHEITLEVAQHLGDNIVRTVSLKPTDGLVRGSQVRDTGAPISAFFLNPEGRKVEKIPSPLLSAPAQRERKNTARKLFRWHRVMRTRLVTVYRFSAISRGTSSISLRRIRWRCG